MSVTGSYSCPGGNAFLGVGVPNVRYCARMGMT